MLNKQHWILIIGTLCLGILIGIGTWSLHWILGVKSYWIKGGLVGFVVVVGTIVLNWMLHK